MLEYSINQYVYRDGTKPFGKAPDSKTVIVHWKDIRGGEWASPYLNLVVLASNIYQMKNLIEFSILPSIAQYIPTLYVKYYSKTGRTRSSLIYANFPIKRSANSLQVLLNGNFVTFRGRLSSKYYQLFVKVHFIVVRRKQFKKVFGLINR